MNARVWGVVATYQRPALLRRLLVSLADQGPALAGVIIVDNGGTQADEADLRAVSPVPLQWLAMEKNLGTGGGVARGIETALQDAATTHCWVMDDDMVAEPGVLSVMLETSETEQAAAVAPLLVNDTGRVAWFPGPLSQPAWSVIRRNVTPDEFRQRCGVKPLRWNWAIWASLLISRRAIETVGLPDERLWYQGSDIEYTLRLSARFRTVLKPAAVCQHLNPVVTPEESRRKILMSLQNAAYTFVRLRHGWRALRHLPGNHYRYWRDQRFAVSALLASITAFWRGAVLGRPVGLNANNQVSSD